MIKFNTEKFLADVRKASEELAKAYQDARDQAALVDFGKILKRYGKEDA